MLHVLVCVSLIALVLLQQGKGADVGAAFGSGSSNTMFGSAGSTPFLVKVTGLLAAVFFATSLALSYLVAKQVKTTNGIESVPTTTMPTVPVPASNPAPETPN